MINVCSAMDYRQWQVITYVAAKANQNVCRAAGLRNGSPLVYFKTLGSSVVCSFGKSITPYDRLWFQITFILLSPSISVILSIFLEG